MVIADAWLSGQLGRAVFRVELRANVEDRSPLPVAELRDEMRPYLARQPVFLYCKTDTADLDSVALLESSGFHLIETSVQQRKLIENERAPDHTRVRFAVSEDMAETVELARGAFIYTRFHVDSRFRKEEAHQVKAEWVRNYFLGQRGDHLVLGIDKDGRIAGFVQLIQKQSNLIIDLIAVGVEFRRQGFAEDMIRFAQTAIPGVTTIEVGTQITNAPSLRLYGRLGFQMYASRYVFHYHK